MTPRRINSVNFSKLLFVDRLLCCCFLWDLFSFVGYFELLQCTLHKEDFIMAAFQLLTSARRNLAILRSIIISYHWPYLTVSTNTKACSAPAKQSPVLLTIRTPVALLLHLLHNINNTELLITRSYYHRLFVFVLECRYLVLILSRSSFTHTTSWLDDCAVNVHTAFKCILCGSSSCCIYKYWTHSRVIKKQTRWENWKGGVDVVHQGRYFSFVQRHKYLSDILLPGDVIMCQL